MAKLDEIRELLEAEAPESVDESPEEVTAESESESEEVETPEPEEPEVEASGSSDEPVDDEIVTIASLAADLEIEPEKLYGMVIPVEGQDKPLTIGELKDLAQAKQAQTEEVEATQTKLAEREAELLEKERELYSQLENVNPQELVKAEAAVAKAESEYAGVNWQQLEATNPGEAALKRQKIMEQYQIAVYNRDQVKQTLDRTRESIEQQREAAQQQQLQQAIAQLHTLIPEWRDETVYMREREHMVNKLVASGIPEQSVRSIGDPALIKYLKDSLETVEKIEEAQPIQKAPKVLKASAVQSKGRGKKQADKRFLQKAAKSKDRAIKQDAVRQLITGAIQ
jgi:hypothetical protein